MRSVSYSVSDEPELDPVPEQEPEGDDVRGGTSDVPEPEPEESTMSSVSSERPWPCSAQSSAGGDAEECL